MSRYVQISLPKPTRSSWSVGLLEVWSVVRAVQPRHVMVELCDARRYRLEAQKLGEDSCSILPGRLLGEKVGSAYKTCQGCQGLRREMCFLMFSDFTILYHVCTLPLSHFQPKQCEYRIFLTLVPLPIMRASKHVTSFSSRSH